MKMYRQGDVLIEAVDVLSESTPIKPKNGRLILAEGEATGHYHSVDANCGTLGGDRDDVMWLTVDQLTEVTHQEHAPIALPVGKYRVTRQREYTPERNHWVACRK